MLAKKRGALRDKSRKMAKKAQAAALQTDVTTDEEWQKILNRKGLVLVDIYSEWSGPCTGMVSVLRKVKMEMGGDTLSYAVARCDNITALVRFRGKSEPAWMFLREGKVVNMLFGANCPRLLEMLLKELKRTQDAEPPIFSVPVDVTCPVETERNKEIEEAFKAREADRLAKLEAKEKAKYEAYLAHLLESLRRETLIILFPWVFKDEEGNKRDKKSSPAYTELVELFAKDFTIVTEIWKELTEEDLDELKKETDYEFTEETKYLLMDGRCMCIHLKAIELLAVDLEALLANLLFEENEIPITPDDLVEGCYAQRFMSPLRDVARESESFRSIVSASREAPEHQDDNDGGQDLADVGESYLILTTFWVPSNPRNKAVAFLHIFKKYVEKTYPFEEEEEEVLVCLFKYDSTRRKELQIALETYQKDVLNFAVFERDRLPNPKIIAYTIKQFEEDIEEKTSYEAFIVVIKRANTEAFLTFAGIGPYHISETPEKAEEEAEQFFPPENTEEGQDNQDGQNAQNAQNAQDAQDVQDVQYTQSEPEEDEAEDEAEQDLEAADI